MDRDLGTIWGKTLEKIARNGGRPANHWLRHAEPLALLDDTMLIAVPNRLASEWIQAHMGDELSTAVSTVMGQDVVLRFVAPEGENGHTHVAAMEQPLLDGLQSPPDRSNDQNNGQGQHSAPRNQSAEKQSNGTYGKTTPALTNPTSQRLNPRYTFDTFVMGSANQLAHAAARAVAQAPARAYNPLFIYGGVGLGKTHLLQAIAHHCLAQQPKPRVVYISSETFTNELIDAIQERQTTEFRARYRSVDILLVDDIQFLAGKDQTQEEFFHTFNALHEANRQIVLSSDRPPKEIKTLEERLRSRFEGGLISDIQRPDFETRIAILRKKAEMQQITVDEAVIRFIAERIQTNVREMEGALVRLAALASLRKVDVTVDLAQETLKDLLPDKQRVDVTIPLIQERVASHFDLTVKDLKRRKRTRALVIPRQIAMYLSRELTDSSLPKIGEEFGGRDHSTVIYAHEKVAKEIEKKSELAATVERLKRRIRGGD